MILLQYPSIREICVSGVISPSVIYLKNIVIKLSDDGVIVEISHENKDSFCNYIKVNGKYISFDEKVLALPSYSTLHTHIYQYFLLPYCIGKDLRSCLNEVVFNYENILDDELSYFSAILSIDSLVRKGITVIFDLHCKNGVKGSLRALNEIPILVNIAISPFDEYERLDANEIVHRLDDIYEIIHKQNVSNTIRHMQLGLMSVIPLIKYLSYSKVRSKINLISERWGIHTHANEEFKLQERLQSNLGLDEISLIVKNIELNSKSIIAHLIHTSDISIYNKLKRAGVNIAITPVSNLFLRDGIHDNSIYKYPHLAFGIDGFVSDKIGDIMENIRVFWHIHNQISNNFNYSLYDFWRQHHETTKRLVYNTFRLHTNEIRQGFLANIVLYRLDIGLDETFYKLNPNKWLLYNIDTSKILAVMSMGKLVYINSSSYSTIINKGYDSLVRKAWNKVIEILGQSP